MEEGGRKKSERLTISPSDWRSLSPWKLQRMCETSFSLEFAEFADIVGNNDISILR